MFIKSLTIKNFRCFGSGTDNAGTKINLNEGLSAFVGKNGSGKTSILEAINYLIGSDYLPTRVSEKDFNSEAKEIKDEIIIEGETVKPFFFEIDVVTNEKSRLETVIIPCKAVRLTVKRREKAERILDDPFIVKKTVIPLTGNINDDIYASIEYKKSYKIVSLEEIDNRITDLDQARAIIKDLLRGETTNIEQEGRHYSVKFRLKSTGQYRTASFPGYSFGFNAYKVKGLAKSYYLSKGRDNDVSGSYSLIAKILTDLHWRYKREHSKGNGPSIQDEYDKLANSLRNIVDEKNKLIHSINRKIKSICSADQGLQFDFMDIEQPYKSAFFTKQVGEKILLPNNLGSGYNILIAYALFAYVADLESVPIVLLIDEPELHLHSDWQKKMYKMLSEQTDLQVIYSTQSENFISLKRWQQVRRIVGSYIYPEKKTLQEQIAAIDGETASRQDYLDDYAKKNLDISLILRENLELFFADKCILVEGPEEKYALPKLLKLLGCEIEDYPVSVIPVWGKTKILTYQMICRCYGVDYFTMFDEDKNEDDEPDSANINIETNSQSGKMAKLSSSLSAKLGVAGDHKFNRLVKAVDGLTDANLFDQETKDCIERVKDFIERAGVLSKVHEFDNKTIQDDMLSEAINLEKNEGTADRIISRSMDRSTVPDTESDVLITDEIWKIAIDETGEKATILPSLLRDCKKEVKQKTITIFTKFKFHHDRLLAKNAPELLEDILEQLTGTRYSVVCTMNPSMFVSETSASNRV